LESRYTHRCLTWFNDLFNAAFDSAASEPTIEVTAQLQRLRSLFGRAELDAARASFIAQKDQAYAVLTQADLDRVGRTIARRYLDAFYQQMTSDDPFYGPLVVAAQARAYASPDGSPACGSRSMVPAGTAISDPTDTRGLLIPGHRPGCAVALGSAERLRLHPARSGLD
jgi:hypothetical protein